MHVQVVTYDRGMMGEQAYIDLAHQIAPTVASAPGLLAAVWLDGSETGMYGGLFFWEDHASMERFTDSQFFAGAFGPFGDVIIGHADVLENVTQLSQPSLQIVPPRNGQAGAQARQPAASPKRLGAQKALTAKKPSAGKKAPAKKTSPAGRRPSAGTRGKAAGQNTKSRSAAKKSPATTKRAPASKSSAGPKRKVRPKR